MKTSLFLTLFAAFSLSACSVLVPVRSSGVQPTPLIDKDSLHQPLMIDDVKVEVGVGSPIPVHVVVSGNLPDTCAQVASLQQMVDGRTFHIYLSTLPLGAEGCIQDTLPFSMSIPLNIVSLPPGVYTIDVNGVTRTLSIPVQ